jgi:hypothetical protein
LRECDLLVQADHVRVSTNLAPSINAARHRVEISVLERIEMAPRDLRLLRNLLDGEATPFSGGAQKLAESSAAIHLQRHIRRRMKFAGRIWEEPVHDTFILKLERRNL